MQELQALIQGKISAQAIDIDQLLALAKKYNDPNSSEYKLVDLATNIVLAKYLEKAKKVI
ncbi:hypothetical protein F7P75_11630 [Acinetobacter gandensis]|uniref:Uncharacterized protein n=1 Tax=Acinetobacter gandensis TaxID=1443941 RepID=A0A1A7RCK0_9GAMM|nr:MULTISPECIES: hypothetical protein [Acinetobacter]KAB0625123.1 hypothetical protein F7P75_11630 [Acinetobacter gandensis]OBX29980.1 hypothetical protein A9J31_00225 [Acinetobacter gandensis]